MDKVNIRGGFSDRNGIKPVNTEIQLKDFDERTRIQLQNTINELYYYTYAGSLNRYNDYIQEFIVFVLGQIYSKPIDKRKKYADTAIDMINSTILNDDYDDVLSLIEALVNYWDSYLKKDIDYMILIEWFTMIFHYLRELMSVLNESMSDIVLSVE